MTARGVARATRGGHRANALLVPGIDGLDIDRTDSGVPLSEEVRHEMAPDEAASASQHNQIILIHKLTFHHEIQNHNAGFDGDGRDGILLSSFISDRTA